MLDQNSVITQATKGIIKPLAHLRGVTVQRIYEQLSPAQCVYNKAKTLIEDIGELDKDAVRLIKADMDAHFARVLTEEPSALDIAALHRESSEAVCALLEGKPRPVQIKELRESAAATQKVLVQLETGRLAANQAQAEFINGAH